MVSHSVMFHHFHDGQHMPSQGSIDADDLIRMLDWLEQRYTILGAQEYSERLLSRALKSTDICLSFDDGLKSQFDVALPVLQERGINAFFFVYSSVFSGVPERLELYRYFRHQSFESLADFYSEFFYEVEQQNPVDYERALSVYDQLDYLGNFPFYTDDDKWFRYLRDRVLGNERYNQTMDQMISSLNFDIDEAVNNLWMNDGNLTKLSRLGHVVGLHSYSHPTVISSLAKDLQREEYSKNFEHLRDLLGQDPYCMSHPCGDYNLATLSILESMGIHVGFRSSLHPPKINSFLEVPREDHANVLRKMGQ